MATKAKNPADVSDASAAELDETDLEQVSGAEVRSWDKVQELRSGAHLADQTGVNVFRGPGDRRE